MTTRLITVAVVMCVYLLGTLWLGWRGARAGEDTPDGYFLAGRTIGPWVTFFTLISTNFSAFFFLGFAGAGYRIGYSYYAMMSLGTAFVAVNFYWIGSRVWRLGQEHGYITPPELMGDQLGSRTVGLLYLVVMVVFTLPYLALQPLGGGYLLEALTDGVIPFWAGSLLLTACIVLYVFLGGMRSVAWTDVLQGLLMFCFMLLAVILIARHFGGLGTAHAKVYALKPALFSRAGIGPKGQGYFTPQRWFSLMALWFFCVPMFPQMMMRFFIPKRASSLKTSAVFYPVVTASLFLCPVIIGVLGHLDFPGLSGKAADKILLLMLLKYTPAWLMALVMVGAVAAMMSTLDSQLLALSSMLTRDGYVSFVDPKASMAKQVRVGRFLVVVLALIGLVIAYFRPATIFQIAKFAFSGLAMLFPATVAALYAKRVDARSCALSIVVGESLVIAWMLGGLPKSWTFGFLPVIPALVVTALIVVLGGLCFGRPRPSQEIGTSAEGLRSRV